MPVRSIPPAPGTDAGTRILLNMRQVFLHPDEDGGWVAEIPSLPGCISEGETKEDALRNIRDAAESWLEARRELGLPIPPETTAAELIEIPL